MIKNVCLVMGTLFFMVFIFTSVSAGIILSEPKEIYNLGDKISIRADGLVGAEIGNLNINLVCRNRTTNIVKIPASSFGEDDESSYEFFKILDKSDLEISNLTDIVGSCQIVASLGSDASSTKNFIISRDIYVTASLNRTNFNPDDAITVSINAVKANGELVNGFVEAGGATTFGVPVENGFASETFFMPKTFESGEYILTLNAYDENQNGILNEGSGAVSFIINQIASSIILSLSKLEVVPGEDFTIGVEIMDQSGKAMDGSVAVKLISPTKEEIDVIVSAGSFEPIDFPLNSSAGTWVIDAKYEGLEEVKEFEMTKVMKAEFSFEDSVLLIKNIGNVIFNRTVSVLIGEENLDLDLNIGIGETRKFNLKAPQGEYTVVVNDGEQKIEKQGVLLTGNAVGISDLENVGIFKGYSIVWIFLILVIGGVGIVLFRRSRKTKTIGGKKGIFGKLKFMKNKVSSNVSKGYRSDVSNSLNFTKKSPEVSGLDSSKYDGEDKTMVDFTSKKVGTAESALVLKGEKYPSAILCLSVKNHEVLKENARSELNKAIANVKSMKGLVDWRGDYVFLVFSPIITKTYKNEDLAVRAGVSMLNSLKEYNHKFHDKIEFNLGVHSGDLIASKAGEKLKYTSVGNTISFAKRLTDSDSGKLLVSDTVRKKMLRDLKVIKAGEIGEKIIYEVSEIKDKAANEAKLKELLKRM